MKKQVTIDLPDNFEKGVCDECPFSYDSSENGDYLWYCVFGKPYSECPLDVINVIGIDEEI